MSNVEVFATQADHHINKTDHRDQSFTHMDQKYLYNSATNEP